MYGAGICESGGLRAWVWGVAHSSCRRFAGGSRAIGGKPLSDWSATTEGFVASETSTFRRTGADVVERKFQMPGYTGFIPHGEVRCTPRACAASMLRYRATSSRVTAAASGDGADVTRLVATIVQAVAGRPYGRASERALNNEVAKLVVGDQIPSSPQASTKIPTCGECVSHLCSALRCVWVSASVRLSRSLRLCLGCSPLSALCFSSLFSLVCALASDVPDTSFLADPRHVSGRCLVQPQPGAHTCWQVPVSNSSRTWVHRARANCQGAHRHDVRRCHRTDCDAPHHGEGRPQAAQRGASATVHVCGCVAARRRRSAVNVCAGLPWWWLQESVARLSFPTATLKPALDMDTTGLYLKYR